MAENGAPLGEVFFGQRTCLAATLGEVGFDVFQVRHAHAS